MFRLPFGCRARHQGRHFRLPADGLSGPVGIAAQALICEELGYLQPALAVPAALAYAGRAAALSR